ncbi:endoplasmic reticulum protein, partial [Fistulina hepatica ATCC 64428]
YSLTFLLLASEMVTFCVLVAPLPHTLRKKMLHFLSESKYVAKIAYALKISFIFVAILFVDALQRMFRVQAEFDLAKASGTAGEPRTESSLAARRFYAQRNTYLTGFCLFLSLVLTRTFYMMSELIHVQDEYAKLSKNADNQQSVAELKKQVEKKDRDLQALKEQSASQAKEYDRLSTEYNRATGADKSDKKQD